METSGFDDQMIFNEFSSGEIPMGPKAIQHHHPHHHHYAQHQTIIMGNSNGNEINQHQRLPEIHQILPGNSPKMDHYKIYSEVKIESSPYSPNGKIDYINGNAAKVESYSPSPGQKLEFTSNGQYSPGSKIIEYTSTHNMEQQHNMIFQQPQPVDANQQNAIINGASSNFKRKSDENLNNLSGSPPSTINNNVSPSDASSTMPNKKPLDKKKNDPNGVKKKKTR
jgi:hypothetical protein